MPLLSCACGTQITLTLTCTTLHECEGYIQVLAEFETSIFDGVQLKYFSDWEVIFMTLESI